MMIAPEKLTKEKLANVLVRKHRNFLTQYKKEFELLDKIKILEDKQEQLEHWLNSAKDAKEEDIYIKELEQTDNEILKLNEELKKLRDVTTIAPNSSAANNGEDNINNGFFLKNRYKWLKNQISVEEQTLSYWAERYKKYKAIGGGKEEKKKKEKDG
jgi:hypothetical protein